ncbi:MAG: PEP-CTERM system TPR-repeat protein PrsT [Deltaproteobacteria bacterium]|nr:PEP-CTERM system TPR-repeat protein PrsT [Deltaproteobacteria bacterium]
MKLNSIFLSYIVLLSIFLTSCSSQLTTDEYIQSGQALLKKGEWNGAIIEFKNAVKKSPKNAQARALLGEAYLKTFNSKAAVKELKRAVKLDKDEGSFLVLLAKAYEQTNDIEKILSSITVKKSHAQAIKVIIYALRAKALMRSNKINEAKKELELAKSLDENSTDVRLAWAFYEQLNNNTDAQKTWLKPLLEREGGVADAWSQMAEIEQKENNLDAAEKAYTRAISLRKVIHLDYIKRALVRIAQKDFTAAIEDINTLKNAGADWPMVGHAEGVIAYQKADYNNAKEHFENVLSRYPNYIASKLMLGLTQFKREKFQISATYLEQFLSVSSGTFQANFIYAASLLKLGKVTNAIPVLVKLNKSSPDNFQVLSLLGNAYVMVGSYEKGVSLLNKAVALNPESAEIRLQLGTALLRKSATSLEGQQHLTKAIELQPDFIQADLALFMSHMKNKHFIKARKVAQELKEKQKDNPLGVNLEALSYLSDDKKTTAVSLYKDTIKMFPDDSTAYLNLARVYLTDNLVEKAKLLYLKVLEKHPENLKALNQMALIETNNKNPAAVIEWLIKAVERNPDSSSARFSLASQYIAQNEANLALQQLKEVKKEDKDKPGFILLMATVKLELEENQHATRILKTLLSRMPDLMPAHLLLARAYLKENRNDKLRIELDKILRLKPDHLAAQLMFVRLELHEKNIQAFKRRVALMVKAYPENSEVQYFKAKIQSSEKDYQGAIKTLSNLMLKTAAPEIVIDLANNQWVVGDKESAISGLETWLESNPSDKTVLMLLAQYYTAENRSKDVINTYQTLEKLLPDNSMVLNNLAWFMRETNIEQAIVYAERALEVSPDSAPIKDTFAMLLLINGQNENALKYSEDAVNSAPDSNEILFNYIKVLKANGQHPKARGILTDLLNNTKSETKRKALQTELDKF